MLWVWGLKTQLVCVLCRRQPGVLFGWWTSSVFVDFHGTQIDWRAYCYCDRSFSIDRCRDRGMWGIHKLRCWASNPLQENYLRTEIWSAWRTSSPSAFWRRTIVSWIYKITMVQLNFCVLLHYYVTTGISNIMKYSRENKKKIRPERDLEIDQSSLDSRRV